MTTINCSLSCIYQSDGKCTLDDVKASSVSAASECAFFNPLKMQNTDNKITGV